jgi:hypothetical protein
MSSNETILELYTPILLKHYINNNLKLCKKKEIIECCVLIDKCENNVRKMNIDNLCGSLSRMIGTSNPDLPRLVENLVEKWDLNKDDIIGRRALIEIIQLMSKSEKSDRIVHLRYVYGNCMTNENIVNNKKWESVYGELPDSDLDNLWKFEVERDNNILKPLMNKFIHSLNIKDVRVYKYLYQITNLGKDNIRFGQRFKGWKYKTDKALTGRFKAEYAIWEYLFKNCNNYPNGDKIQSNLEVLFKWYNIKNDNIIYLIHGISYFIDNLNWNIENKVEDLDDNIITEYYDLSNRENINISGNLAKKDFLLYINDTDDNLIYSIFKEYNKTKTRKISNSKQFQCKYDDIGEELQEDPLPE